MPTIIFNPVIQVLFGAFLISFSAVWVTLANLPATTSAFYRVFFGCIFLFAASAWSGELSRFSLSRLLQALLCGMAFALDLFFWHASILYIGPGLATILGNFQVFLMAACGFLLFGEKLRSRFILSLPLAIAGLFLVIGFDWNNLSSNYKTGVLFGLLTALCYTVFLLLLKRIHTENNQGPRYSSLMLISFFSALSLGVALFSFNGSFLIPTASAAFFLVCLGLFSQAIGWVLIANALPKIKTSLTGLILLLQPSLSFLWDVLFFSRPTAFLHWLGVIITLIAIYLGLTSSRER